MRNLPTVTATRWMSSLMIVLGLFAGSHVELSALAQTDSHAAAKADAPPPAYDVMSIKLNKTASGDVDIDTDDGRFSATNVSLKALLAHTYEVKQDLISGIPGPLESARFDIEAKIVEPDPVALTKMTREQSRLMLRPLLTDRFQLQTHTEVKTLLYTS